MSSDLNLEVPQKLRLEAAGFRLDSLEADHSIIYMLSPDLRIIYCNKAWDEFASLNGGVGLSREAVLGTSMLDVIAEPLKPYFANGFAQAQKQLVPWDLDYECSSPAAFRLFHMRVFPLPNSYLLVENSLRVERPHGPERPAMPPHAASYLNEHGLLTMCAHCRRTRRINTGAVPIWDWVPTFLMDPPGPVSHGLCRNCRAYFYSRIENTFRSG